MRRLNHCSWAVIIIGALVWTTAGARGQTGAPASGEWRTYGGDLGSTRYSPLDQINAGGGDTGGGLTVQGLPLVKPPWGRITAFDLNKGELVWQIPHGDTPDDVKNHPALKGVDIGRTAASGQSAR